jgi:hypothetical protein
VHKVENSLYISLIGDIICDFHTMEWCPFCHPMLSGCRRIGIPAARRALKRYDVPQNYFTKPEKMSLLYLWIVKLPPKNAKNDWLVSYCLHLGRYQHIEISLTLENPSL